MLRQCQLYNLAQKLLLTTPIRKITKILIMSIQFDNYTDNRTCSFLFLSFILEMANNAGVNNSAIVKWDRKTWICKYFFMRDDNFAAF